VVLLPSETRDSATPLPNHFFTSPRWQTPPHRPMMAAQCMSIVTSREQWQKYLEWENYSSILPLIFCVMFLHMFTVECVLAIGTFMGYSNIAADITNSKKIPDWRRALRQCTTVLYRLLVAIVTGELYFKAYGIKVHQFHCDPGKEIRMHSLINTAWRQ
jgi:hypothetical protein